MKIQSGQLKIVKSIYPNIDAKLCSILAEAGNDNGETFRGNFLVKVKYRKTLRFDNGKLVKTL